MNLLIMVTVFGIVGTLVYLFLPVQLLMRFAHPLLLLFSMVCKGLMPVFLVSSFRCYGPSFAVFLL